jgi:hypothetical protein
MPELKFHEPTGAVPPPFVLVEGEEKAGKSTVIAKFTGCDRIGQTYWIELGSGERTGEWYKKVAGAKYLLADHDAVSTWRGLNEQIDAVAEDVEKRLAAGEKTPMIVIDSMSAEWRGLSKWADWKARNSRSAKKILAADPNADITVGPAYWNPATARHEDLLAKLAAIPAIIIFTARGKEVTEFGKDGQPVDSGRKKTWSVAAQKDLGFFVDCWVRMRRGGPAEIVSCRGVTDDAIQVGVDEAVTVTAVDLEHLIFERYGFDPDNTMRRPDRELDALAPTVEEQRRQDGEQDTAAPAFDEDMILAAAQILEDAENATTRAAISKLWAEAKESKLMLVPLNGKVLGKRLEVQAARVAKLDPAPVNGHAKGEPVGIGS